MKKNVKIYKNGKFVDKEINYIPTRYIVAIFLTVFEFIAMIGIMALLALYVPYFYIAIFVTEIISIIAIVVMPGKPDYKVTWLFFVVMLPLVGLMLYIVFHKRKLPKKVIKRLKNLHNSYGYEDGENFKELNKKDKLLASSAVSLCKTADTHLYKGCKLHYYRIGEELHSAMLEELSKAEKFIFLEYFIIENGYFWNSILDILKEKTKNGVEVKLVYDDIGCMGTLPGNYYKTLTKKYNIETVLFSKLRCQMDGEFNNRSHRKILVIDGKVAFTGGVNIADEYINRNHRLGHWKDSGIKVEGTAVNEFTKLFLSDFYINKKTKQQLILEKYYVNHDIDKNVDNYVIPFGDGPRPIYNDEVSKIAIINILNHSKDYVYMTSPYLIVDTELMNAIKNTALRGVDVRIIVPHIPDKKFVFKMTKNCSKQLKKYGVKVYEYTPGFIHAKSYISDDKVGILGTINLDYRSLTHHFENGVWLQDNEIISEMKEDFLETVDKSKLQTFTNKKDKLLSRLFGVIIKLFEPLL